MPVSILALVYVIVGIILVFCGVKGITQNPEYLSKRTLLVAFLITLLIALSIVFVSIIASEPAKT